MDMLGLYFKSIKVGHPELLLGLAAFEQGALPSLLLLPGIAPVFSLPGDRMFQAVEVVRGLQTPAIMHAYGGAKVGMEKALASIAREGWLPMAAAMLGTVDKPPMWACLGLRPVVGTTIDLKVRPAPISEREKLLLLSCWRQWHPAWEQIQDSALSDWLTGVDVEKGPDGSDSPTFLKQHSEIMQAVGLYQEAKLSPLEDYLLSLGNWQPDPQIPFGSMDSSGAMAWSLKNTGSCQHSGGMGGGSETPCTPGKDCGRS